MRGYRPESYGEGFADVYDDWYTGYFDNDAAVAFLERTGRATPGAPERLRILELAVGTGRLALPLAARGHHVTGVDVSPDMLAVLAGNDPNRRVATICGDMVDDLPDGPFELAFVAYTSLFMLTDPGRQAECFDAVAARLVSGGAFVVDAFVPYDPPRHGTDISLRSMTAGAVVLSISTTDAETQRVDGQFVELRDGEPVRLRPYSLRYSTSAELDRFAAAAGFTLEARYEDVDGTPFDPEGSPRHLSVFRT